jgi:hypothetical protein
MRAGLTVSTALHAGLIAVVALGLGLGHPIEATPVESIAVDLVPISDFSNIRVGSLDSTIVETETPSAVDAETPAEIAQPTGNTEEDQPAPEDTPVPTPAPTVQTAPAPEATEPEPVEETAPVPVERPVEEPPPAPEPEPEPEPVVEPDPPAVETPPLAVDTPAPDPAEAAPKPIVRTAALAEKRADFKKQQEAAKQKAAADAKKKADDEKKKAEDAKKAADKKKADEQKRIEQAKADQAREADQLASIINNEESRGATTGEGGEQTLGRQDGRSATLSQSQIDGLVSQIRGCIAVPPGASEAGSEAQLLFTVAGDGSLLAQPQVISLTSDTVADAYARAVTRAVMRCGPYAVVAGQDVKATFRARDF